MAAISLVRYRFTFGVHMCACYKVPVLSFYGNNIVHGVSPSEASRSLLKRLLISEGPIVPSKAF